MGATSSVEVGDIFRAFGPSYRQLHRGQLHRCQLRAMSAIEQCRTAALGGHLYQCDRCGHEVNCYNSCRNRHCPKCQGLDKQRWRDKRCAELLPVEYFHVVFTLPSQLNPLILHNQRQLYDLLFASAVRSLLELGADPQHLGARMGLLAILHSWSQQLSFHPHLHCIVPGGGLSIDGDWWVSCRPGFLLPVKALSKLFRGKFLAQLRQAYEAGALELPHDGSLQKVSDFESLLDDLYAKDWVVYSKPPFGGPEKVLGYLARYTHRVAISNSRLVRVDADEVVFTWKDYAHGGRRRELSLSAHEFIRRFLLHVLPDHFVRIRYYGLLANRCRRQNIERCRVLLRGRASPGSPRPSGDPSRGELLEATASALIRCPHCGCPQLHPTARLPRRLPSPVVGRSPP
jgi:hypothetical protein